MHVILRIKIYFHIISNYWAFTLSPHCFSLVYSLEKSQQVLWVNILLAGKLESTFGSCLVSSVPKSYLYCWLQLA